ncbi:unnamed protein product [Trichogramma brassicae]|uniref:Uncharacterized protein n=1 Tax=Trichogramma brassicae TaxID=86971 RepID=A0A6H5HUF8_9HYME|nr:unnamed protein product [Trichogramma brassicae]
MSQVYCKRNLRSRDPRISLRRYLVKSPGRHLQLMQRTSSRSQPAPWTARCCPCISCRPATSVQDRYHLQCSSKCKYPPPGPIDGHQQQVAASAPPAPHHVQVPCPPGPIYGYRQQVQHQPPPALHQRASTSNASY